MKKLLGPHLGGQWANKLEILRQWQPRFILLLQPEVDKVKQLRDAIPGAIIVGRFFHDDSHYASNINARPKEFAHEIHQEIANNPVTPLLDYAQSNNETNQDWQGIQKLNEFTQEWMFLADQSQVYKCAILAFSVGNPDMPHKPGDPAGFGGRMLYWQQVLPSLNYAQRNGHILLLHSYGYPNMFAPDADWYIFRYERQVQANLKTLGITNLRYVYGEIGIDRFIVNVKGGYKVATNDQDYTNQLLQWEKDLQGQELLLGGAIFTFGDSGGWDTYDITSTNVASMIATHYADHAGDYDAQSQPKQEVHLPNVSTGTPAQTTLPERQIDPRLIERGVTIETPAVAPGQRFWRVVKARWWNEQESQGRHHIFVEAYDGSKPVSVALNVRWPSGSADASTNGKSGFDAGNFPMSKSLNEFSVTVDEDMPSETLKGIGMGADGNSGVHTSTGVTFQLVTMPAATTPTQPPSEGPTPTNVAAWVIAPAGLNLRASPINGKVITAVPYGAQLRILGVMDTSGWLRVRWGEYEGYMASQYVGLVAPEPLPAPSEGPQAVEPPTGDKWERSLAFVRRWEGGWADDPNDPGGATNKGITLGTYTRWREVHGQSAPTKDDLRALTDAEANSIYDLFYWRESGADKLPWPLCLAHFNLAVNAGPARAKTTLERSNGVFLAYVAEMLDWYTKIDGWKHFGAAWTRRCADVIREAAK